MIDRCVFNGLKYVYKNKYIFEIWVFVYLNNEFKITIQFKIKFADSNNNFFYKTFPQKFSKHVERTLLGWNRF